MLVLSRKKDEVVRIGDQISITVVEVRGDKVRLGIEAPKDMDVHRQEVWEAIQEVKIRKEADAVRGNEAESTGGVV